MKVHELVSELPDDVLEAVAQHSALAAGNPAALYVAAILRREQARRRELPLPPVLPLVLHGDDVQRALAWLEVARDHIAEGGELAGDRGLALLALLLDHVRATVDAAATAPPALTH